MAQSGGSREGRLIADILADEPTSDETFTGEVLDPPPDRVSRIRQTCRARSKQGIAQVT